MIRLTSLLRPRLARRTFLLGTSAAAVLATTAPGAFAQRRGSSPAQVDVTELMKPTALPDIVQGKADAPVTIIEYASMTCGACANFHNTQLPKIKEKYIDTGKAKLIVREFPFDDAAAAVAMLARCTGPDKRDAAVGVFFQTHAKWTGSSNMIDGLFGIAKQIGFTQEAFDKCLTDQKLLEGVTEIRERGAKVFLIEGTPTFFVNGKRATAQTLEAAIEAALPKS